MYFKFKSGVHGHNISNMAHSALNPHYLLLSSILGLGFALEVNDLVGFDNISMTVPENIGQVKICVTHEVFEIASIRGRIFTTNPDKTAPVTSVGNLSQTFLINYFLNPTFCYNATVVDNNIVEFGKVYYINITSFDEDVLKIENRSVLVISITNDDTVSIGFSESSLTVSESDGYARVCMNRVGEAKNLGEGQVPSGALSVRLFTVQGTAKSDEDFTPLNSFPVHFGLDEMSKCVNVSIKSDNVKENMETFYITMTNGSSLVIVNETRNKLTVNIREKDERSRRRDIYILLIVAIVVIVFLFICGIVLCICFIKSKKRTDR